MATRLIDSIRRFGLAPYSGWTADDAHHFHQTLDQPLPIIAIDTVVEWLNGIHSSTDNQQHPPTVPLDQPAQFLLGLPNLLPIFPDAFYETLTAPLPAINAVGCYVSVIDLWDQTARLDGSSGTVGSTDETEKISQSNSFDPSLRLDRLTQTHLTQLLHQQNRSVSPWEPANTLGNIATPVRWVVEGTFAARYATDARVVYGPTGVIALALTPEGRVARSLTNNPVVWGPHPEQTIGLIFWWYATLVTCALMRLPKTDVHIFQIQLDPVYVRNYRKRVKREPTPFYALVANPTPETQHQLDQGLPPSAAALALNPEWMAKHLWQPLTEPPDHPSRNGIKSEPLLTAGNG